MANPVLVALDKAKTQTYHFKAIVIAGMGFFTDAYDLFVISALTKLLGRIYYYDPSLQPSSPGLLHPNVNSAVVATALCGTLAGQLFFGWLGDKFGRKSVYGMTLALMVIASLGQGLSFGKTSTSVIATLCFFRFWLGFGIGGDYPLSATIMAEYSNTRTRGAFVAAVFAMQGFGFLTGAVVTLIISAIFKHQYYRLPFNSYKPPGAIDQSLAPQADWVWRLVLMFGAIPAALTFYARSKMPETARYTALVEKDQQQAALDMKRVLHTEFDTADVAKAAEAQKKAMEFGLFSRQFLRRHGKELFGTCVAWFLLDVSFYSQSLLQPAVFSAVGWVPKAKYMSALDETYKNAKAQTIIALIGTIPGYWFTVAFIDRVGRKPIQLMGFFFMTAFMLVLAFRFDKFSGEPTAFIIVYGLTFFFTNFGPNATTFIVPAELFPARLRSTCHGISSASGKAGAIVGTFAFLYLSQGKTPAPFYRPSLGDTWSFFILAMCSLLGFFVTLICIPETKGRSLEEISGEDAVDNGADGDLPKEIHDNGTYT